MPSCSLLTLTRLKTESTSRTNNFSVPTPGFVIFKTSFAVKFSSLTLLTKYKNVVIPVIPVVPTPTDNVNLLSKTLIL